MTPTKCIQRFFLAAISFTSFHCQSEMMQVKPPVAGISYFNDGLILNTELSTCDGCDSIISEPGTVKIVGDAGGGLTVSGYGLRHDPLFYDPVKKQYSSVGAVIKHLIKCQEPCCVKGARRSEIKFTIGNDSLEGNLFYARGEDCTDGFKVVCDCVYTIRAHVDIKR